MSTNIVTCLSWIPRGVAQAVPTTLNLTQEDIRRVIAKTHGNASSSATTRGDVNTSTEANMEVDDIVARYNLDDYDSDRESDDGENGAPNVDGNIADLVVYSSNQEDPYLAQAASDSEDEREDFEIKPTDNLLAVGHVEGDAAILEVHLYNHSSDDFYPHHDLVLPAYPISLKWIQTSAMKNCVACGDMNEVIHVYNLDVVNVLEASIELTGHEGPVLSLDWDGSGKLASTSADKRALIWDLESASSCFKLPRKAKGDIHTCQFCPENKNIIAIGDESGVVSFVDERSAQIAKKVNIPDGGEVEKVAWNKLKENNIFVASNKGNVFAYDFANGSLVYTISAHEDGVTGLIQSKHLPNCLVTGSEDKTVKIWDVSSGTQGSFVHSKKCKVGKVLALEVNPDEKLTLAVGGDSISDNIKIVDLTKVKSIKEHFQLNS